eukprot:12041250-Karenia_brevis.AAC.1
MRPEHINEMLGVRQRPLANGLLTAISNLRSLGAQGTLPHCARWILDSRLTFLRKKSGPKPRPIRIGEVWRRIIAKGLVHDDHDRI